MQKHTILTVLWLAFWMPAVCSAAAETDTRVLCTASDELAPGTMWRYFETWQSDVVRLPDKTLLTADIFADKVKVDDAGSQAGFTVKKAARIMGSDMPQPNWQGVDFDDSGWGRHRGPMPNVYRSLALVCLRGKFRVSDPSRVRNLRLTIQFQGGAIAYLNGREVGRAHLPAQSGTAGPPGNATDITLAEDYPHETFVDAQERLLQTPFEYGRSPPLASSDPRGQAAMRNADNARRIQLRARVLDVAIPAGALRKGVNVLAVEIHRAPAETILFTGAQMWTGHYYQPGALWNRAQCESIELRADADAGAIVPNTTRPEGLQVWEEDVFTLLRAPATGMMRYADPNEGPPSITLRGVKNGVVSGQIVAGSRKPLSGLKATVSPLTGDGGTIPASAVDIAYLDLESGALESVPPALKAPPLQVGRTAVKNMDKAVAESLGVLQPVWLTVRVPRGIRAGAYSGTLSVAADGEKAVVVPVQLKVVGDWTAPDPSEFRTWIVAHESPDSVAMQYGVPLWSEEHWRHLDRVYALLAQIGVKDIHLPVIAKTHLANEQSMVRWIQKPDGSYEHDFSILERYLDLAVRHLGKTPIVCIYIHDYGFRIEQSHTDTTPITARVTRIDPATGQLSEIEPPAWGTPEARAFWKPVIDQCRTLLAKRGLEKSVMFGIAANNAVDAGCVADLKALAPDILWVNRTHFFAPRVGAGNATQAVGFTANVGAAIGVYWNPDAGDGHYAWRNPGPKVVHFPRQGNVYGAVFENCLASFRLFAEGVQLTHGQNNKSYPSVIGIGHIGADFWPVLKDPRGGPPRSMGDRYVFWHSLSLSGVIPFILAPGVQGAVPCPRLQMMRESLQEAEARMFIQDALLDADQRARLGADLAKRCNAICNERTQAFRYISAFCGLGGREDYFRVCTRRAWDASSENLYEAAGAVSKALQKQ